MNENIDLTKILKDCPKGTKFYTPVWGEVVFIEVKKYKKCLYSYVLFYEKESVIFNAWIK